MSAPRDEELIPADDELVPPDDDAGPTERWRPSVIEGGGADDEHGDGWDDGSGRETVLLLNAKDGPKKTPENERWLSSRIGAGPLSWVFLRGSSVVRVVGIGEAGYIEPPNPEASNGPATVGALRGEELSTRLSDYYRFVVQRGPKDEPYFTEEWFPSSDAGRALGTPDRMPYLRPLRGVTHTPLLRAEKGAGLLTEPGYDDESGFLYLPDVEVPAVPSNPTDDELTVAAELLRGLVADFKWTGPHHEANYLGALITPLMKLVTPPPYKQVLITARERGSGKGLLAEILTAVHGGTLRAWSADDAELEKVLSAILSQTTAPVCQFDNIRGVLRSARWEALLTAKVYHGRILGSTNSVAMPNDRLWVLTGNNMKAGGDLDRRSLWVDIDPGCPNPELRTEFEIPDLARHVAGHRGEILAALLTLLAAWDARGRVHPKASADVFGPWIAAVRGVLSLAAVPGTFDHAESQDVVANPDTEELETFYAALREAFPSGSFTVKTVIERARGADGDRLVDALPGTVGDDAKWKPGAAAKSLGRWFGNHTGQWYGGLTVRRAGEKGRDGVPWCVMNRTEVAADRAAREGEVSGR